MDREHRLDASVRAVVASGPDRCVGGPGHAAARAYLERRLGGPDLRLYGDAFALPYRAHGVGFTNLVGLVPGRDRSAAPVLIGAHCDTVAGTPGADATAGRCTPCPCPTACGW